jgi:hypothetical protein
VAWSSTPPDWDCPGATEAARTPYAVCVPRIEDARAHSSVVEHSPYKRGVTGSNPVAPTRSNVGDWLSVSGP